MIQNSNYSSLRKTPKAKESTSQKASSQNLDSKCSASHANGAKAAIIIPHNYFGYSSLLKTPKAKENTFQKASSSQNLNSKCFANHANEVKAPIVKVHNSYPMLNQGKVNLYQSRGSKLNSPALLDNSSRSVVSSETRVLSGHYEGGCFISAIACVAKVSYDVAREAAIEHGGFYPYAGMRCSGAIKTLEHLGIGCTYRPFQPQNWADFPDKAIIGVTVPGYWRDKNHVAVFSRKNGQGWIYDSDFCSRKVKCDIYYPPDPTDYHIEIHKKKW
jgi:hypothetical protein